MTQIRSIERRVKQLAESVNEGISVHTSEQDLQSLQLVVQELKEVEQKIVPLKNNLANSLAAKRDRENQQLLKRAGLGNVKVQDIVKQYIEDQQNSKSDQADVNNVPSPFDQIGQ